MIRLASWARGALWIGLGAFLGFAVGALILDSGTALELSWVWALLVALYAGSIVVTGRIPNDPVVAATPATPAGAQTIKARPAPAPKPRASGPLTVEFTFPDIPAEFPPVMGVNERLRVLVRVLEPPAKPSEGAAVRLSGALRDGAQFVAGEGVTGSDGSVLMSIAPPGTGELVLEAEASHGALVGVDSTSVSIVRYDEEIERLFGEFRTYAVSILGPESHADTARELAEKLRVRSSPEVSRALLELARVYELVAYGERDADRTMYVALLRALIVLEGGSAPPSAPARPAGA